MSGERITIGEKKPLSAEQIHVKQLVTAHQEGGYNQSLDSDEQQALVEARRQIEAEQQSSTGNQQ